MSNKKDDFEELVIKCSSFCLHKFVAQWVEKREDHTRHLSTLDSNQVGARIDIARAQSQI